MKEENKKEIKKGILTGVGTAVGAGIGAIVENTMNAADVEVKEVPEAEVVEEVIEDLKEATEVDQSTMDVEILSSEEKVNAPMPHITLPEKKPTQQNVVGSISDPTSEEDTGAIEEGEEVIEVETEPEVIAVEESVADEDIMVVSVVPQESDEDEADVYNATSGMSDHDVISEDDTIAPDYADMKDNDLSGGTSIISAIDMPDYVNDANIDSFTDNV